MKIVCLSVLSDCDNIRVLSNLLSEIVDWMCDYSVKTVVYSCIKSMKCMANYEIDGIIEWWTIYSLYVRVMWIQSVISSECEFIWMSE